MELRAEDPTTPLARQMQKAMNADVMARYPNGLTRAAEPVFELFFVGHTAAGPVACGGLCRYDEETGEIRRMYVAPSARGQGHARRLLEALLTEARQRGYQRVRLETGVAQPEAVRLYERAGFLPIPAYGIYVDEPQSLCFEIAT